MKKVNEKEITEAIADRLMVKKSLVKREASFIDDLGADSLDFVDMLMHFEGQYDIDFDDDEMTDIKTVGHLIDGIKDRLGIISDGGNPIPDGFRDQDGCWNCARVFRWVEQDEDTEWFCNADDNRPPCGSVIMGEAFKKGKPET